ncbi:hypothetical protein ACGFMM_17855 [Streptomyces sp. NPDC048604]|uniref:hypothetical protein n=1 Tax=Streptomyces sp. NPDC048604 TaxID=3365578 RepID=UPI0037159111
MNGRGIRHAHGTRRGITAALTALAAVAVAVPAGTVAAEAAARPCVPSIKQLRTLTPTGGGAVSDLGRRGLSVGQSDGKPVYWRGDRVRQVPLPAGYTGGTVAAVNRHGLMAGTFTAPGRPPAAFSYRAGARTATLLPGGGTVRDINASGRIVGQRQDGDTLVGVEWQGRTVRRELALPAHVRLEEIGGINDAGQIVGHGYGWDADGAGYYPALMWSADATAAAVELPPLYPGDTYTTYQPREIDERGRIVGVFTYSRALESSGLLWTPPYAEDPRYLPTAGRRTAGVLEDLSPTTGAAVGTAADSTITGPWPPETAPPPQAQYWPGTGPVLALPRLAATGLSGAYAVDDRDRVAGRAADATGRIHPVIWTCASKQAYDPPTGS